MLAVDIEQRLGDFALKVAFEATVPVVALFGRSGSGKTSIINAIAGISKPGRGSIRFGDSVFSDTARSIWVPPEARRIGYVFQDGLLFPHMSVEANLFYGSKDKGGGGRIIELLGLGALLRRKPQALSGGEKQRVAIGRALLSEPRLLLLDEPLASLDGERKGEILTHIERLRDELHIPMVLVSHAVDEVVRLADTMVLIDAGRVKASGSVADIMGRLDLTPLTGHDQAGAVIETRVESHDARYELTRLAFSGGELTVPRLTAQAGERVRVRIGARDVSLATQPPQDISINNILAGTLIEIDESGDPRSASVDVRVAVGEAALIARLTRQSLDRLALRPGQPVYALVKAVSLDRSGTGHV